MISKVTFTVSHGEDTDRLQAMINHVMAEYDTSMSLVYPGRVIVLDYEVNVDIG